MAGVTRMETAIGCDPANPWLALPAVVEDVVDEIPGVATYRIRIQGHDAARRFQFRPGQFNMLYLPGLGEVAISVSGDPQSASPLPHTIREAGKVTQALARAGRGTPLGLRGPFGTSWPIDECAGKDVVLVAGGIGLAPLRPMIYTLLANRRSFGALTLLYGARTPDDLLYTSEFADWTNQGLAVQATVDRATRAWPRHVPPHPGSGKFRFFADGDKGAWSGHVGVVTLLLERLPLVRPDQTILMTCGPEVMMWYSIQTARERGLSETNLWMSLERNMNCAIGLCGHCQFGPTFICKDGPVFRYDRIAPFLEVKSL
ncbi:MAG TPA: FAD/NAD(P)-binding protein [Planctomycetaceae bacterium]|jgi:NAD(P)H-flavin reductase|nr:FAD/NAD(P)-binding protein [Planctomycetaceae bacterium]